MPRAAQQSPGPNPGARFEAVLFALFLALLVWAPLPFGSNRIWAGALLAGLLGTLLSLWLLLCAAGHCRVRPQIWRSGRLPLGILLLLQVWVAVQLLPLPPQIIAVLSPGAHDWHLHDGWISISLDPEYGRFYLLRGCALSAAFFLALALVNSTRRLRILLYTLVLSGSLQAAYGAFMVLSGLEYGFLVEKYAGRGVVTGTFINRNHLAGYLVMTLAAGIGLLLSYRSVTSSGGSRERMRHWLRLMLSRRFRLRLYVAIMIVGLLLTGSRMGNVALFAAMGVAAVLSYSGGRRLALPAFTLMASLFLLDILVLGNWFGFDELVQRLGATAPEAEVRWWSNAYTLEYLRQFLLSGSGGGSFYGVFPNFQPAELEGFHAHAHNDYLEFAVELGLPAAMLLFTVPLYSAYCAWCVQRLGERGWLQGGAFTVLMAVAWAALHSLVDFNLQIMANALTFVVITALGFVIHGLASTNGGATTRNL